MAVILQPLDSPHGVHKRNTNTPRLLIANMKKPRILLVDDDPNVLPVVAKLLAAHGLNAESFTSAADLLSTIQPEDVGCVVTDLEMPGMSGIELQQALLDRESSMAIIVISGHADVPRAIRIMSQGAIMLLEKPFKAQQLVVQVERGIECSQQIFSKRQRINAARKAIGALTEEELAIMKLSARGSPNKSISYELAISARTLDRRRHSAFSKLKVQSVADFAVLLATSEERL
tara:strand:+ start:318 stop:1013 length:696 start_codon:yes stop_codon:yes gene_type:complete